MNWYPWVVFVHVAAAFLFVMGLGASMWASDQIRPERDPERIKVLLEMSSRSLGMVYGGLLVRLIAVIIVLMYVLASSYYARVREAVGLRSMRTPKDAPDPTPVSPEELAVLVDT